jgi:hypothetical protein
MLFFYRYFESSKHYLASVLCGELYQQTRPGSAKLLRYQLPLVFTLGKHYSRFYFKIFIIYFDCCVLIQLLAVLEDFHSIQPFKDPVKVGENFAIFLGLLGPLRPRYYSIASSPAAIPNHLRIVYKVSLPAVPPHLPPRSSTHFHRVLSFYLSYFNFFKLRRSSTRTSMAKKWKACAPFSWKIGEKAIKSLSRLLSRSLSYLL